MLVLLEIYALFVCLGFGISCYLTGWFNKRWQLAWALSPLMGYALVVICSVYFLSYTTEPSYWLKHVGFCLLGLSAILTLLAVLNKKNKHSVTYKSIPYYFIIIVCCLFLALNNYHDGVLTNYLNPDIAAYAATSSWLGDGNNLQGITGYLVSEILSSALRWGLPATAGMAQQMLALSPYQSLFPIVFIIFTSSCFGAGLLFNASLNKSNINLTQIIAIAAVFNGSLLYFLTDGFFPYVIGTAGVTILIALLAIAKHHACKWQVAALSALLAAVLITTCSELFCLGCAVVVGVIVIDLIKRQRINDSLYFLVGIAVGVLLVSPLAYKIIFFTIANVNNAGGIGYLQPTWVWPSDIVSLTNIYSDSYHYFGLTNPSRIITRQGMTLILASVLSLWTLYIFFGARKNTLFITLLLGTLAIWVGNRYLNIAGVLPYGPYNYMYDKLVIVFAPTYIAFFYTQLAKHVRSKTITITLALFFTGLSAVLFIHDREIYTSSVDINAIKEINEHYPQQHTVFLNFRRGERQGTVEPRLRWTDRASDIIMEPLLGYRSLDPWDTSTWAQFPANSTIVIIARRDNFPDHYDFKQGVYEFIGPYVLMNTHTTLGQLTPADKTPVTLDQVYAMAYPH